LADGQCVDIAGSGDIYLRISNYLLIKSIKIRVTTGCAPTCTDDIDSYFKNYRRIIACDLYQGQNLSGVFIGTVAYGHIVSSPYSDGSSTTYNMTSSNNVKLGTVPAYHTGCSYYTGQHSHMEVSSGGTVMGLGCGNTVGSTTAIYTFTYHW
jgi:hypothetical protein